VGPRSTSVFRNHSETECVDLDNSSRKRTHGSCEIFRLSRPQRQNRWIWASAPMTGIGTAIATPRGVVSVPVRGAHTSLSAQSERGGDRARLWPWGAPTCDQALARGGTGRLQSGQEGWDRPGRCAAATGRLREGPASAHSGGGGGGRRGPPTANARLWRCGRGRLRHLTIPSSSSPPSSRCLFWPPAACMFTADRSSSQPCAHAHPLNLSELSLPTHHDRRRTPFASLSAIPPPSLSTPAGRLYCVLSGRRARILHLHRLSRRAITTGASTRRYECRAR